MKNESQDDEGQVKEKKKEEGLLKRKKEGWGYWKLLLPLI